MTISNYIKLSTELLNEYNLTHHISALAYREELSTSELIGISDYVKNNEPTIHIGSGSSASGWGSIAIGSGATEKTGGYSIAIGEQAKANGLASPDVIAIGHNAKANISSAVQLGDGENNDVSSFQFMNTKIVNSNGDIPNESLEMISVVGVLRSDGTTITSVPQSKLALSSLSDTIGKGITLNENGKLSAQYYIHPPYTEHSNGFYKVTVDECGHVSSVKEVEKEDITNLGIVAKSDDLSVINDNQISDYAKATHNHDGKYLGINALDEVSGNWNSAYNVIQNISTHTLGTDTLALSSKNDLGLKELAYKDESDLKLSSLAHCTISDLTGNNIIVANGNLSAQDTTYTAKDGDALYLDGTVFGISVDGTTVKIVGNQLSCTAPQIIYKAGDGLEKVGNDTFKISNDYFGDLAFKDVSDLSTLSSVYIKDETTGDVGDYNNLSIIKLPLSSYELSVVNGTLSNKTLYVVDSDYLDMYGMQICALTMSDEETKRYEGIATTKPYVDEIKNTIMQYATQLSSEFNSTTPDFPKIANILSAMCVKLNEI